MSFAIGDKIGDYEVTGPLGAGGMGRVYRVRHVISQRDEAMKVLLRDLRTAPDLAERFIREIQVQARLNHPNIAALHTALRVDNQLLMVMELVEGDSLRARMKQPGVGLWEGIDYCCQVLDALAYSHQQGVTHRDIKPSNIMLTRQGAVKLLDFGLATVAGDHRLTKTGAIVGSVHYMSPEQIRSEPVDARSDIYSTGITLWEIAAGRCPFEAEAEYAILTEHLEAIPEPPRAEKPEVPEALWQILLRALEKRVEDRYQTAEEFHTALRGLRGGSSTLAARAVTALAQTRTLHAGASAAPSTPAAPPPERPSDPNLLDKITRDLAVFIGPIARVLVKRTAPRAKSMEDLYKKLAEEIESPSDREKFLASRHRKPQ